MGLCDSELGCPWIYALHWAIQSANYRETTEVFARGQVLRKVCPFGESPKTKWHPRHNPHPIDRASNNSPNAPSLVRGGRKALNDVSLPPIAWTNGRLRTRGRTPNTKAIRALACYYLKCPAVTLLLMLNGAYFAEFTKASCEGNIYCVSAIRE
jgi:hypothetical protein